MSKAIMPGGGADWLLNQEASQELKQECWDEVEVSGVATVKGDEYPPGREALAVNTRACSGTVSEPPR